MQRATVIAAAALTLVFAGVLIYFGMQEEFGVLFSNLKEEEAQAIIEKLKTGNIPYQLSNGGSVISVPQANITELRLQMAADGSLAGGQVGFDIFDKNSFGATDFAQQVNYQRALTGELVKTLEGMSEVQTARVHITPARDSIFTEKQESAKASVVLHMRNNREMSRERAQAVANLLASAVEGLKTSDVSVMDSKGRMLLSPTREGDAGEADRVGSHLEIQNKLEAELAWRVITLLEPITGKDKVRANVSASMDFSEVEETQEKYNPQSAVPRSVQTSSEVRNNPQNQGGVVGPRANDPATAPLPPPAAGAAGANPAAANPGADQRSASNTIYEIDKSVRKVMDKGGRLQRLSVSVVVDNPKLDNKPVPRTPEELKKMQDLVAAALGIDAKRGDQIVVDAISFDPPKQDEPMSFMQKNKDLVKVGIKYGSLILATLLLFFLVIRPARKAISEALKPAPLLLEASKAPGGSLPEGTALATAGSTEEQAKLPASEEDAAALVLEKKEAEGPAPITVAELEAEIMKEMESKGPEVKRTLAIKNLLVDQSKKDASVLAMTIRGWLQEKDKKG